MNKGRLEAFTDAVIAIIATIMILELVLPSEPTWDALAEEGLAIAGYIISFLMIAIFWYFHHNLFQQTEKITPRAFLLNIFWILAVSFFPFVTAWVGKNPKSVVPEFFYGVILGLCMLTFFFLNRQIRKDNPEIPPLKIRKISKHLPWIVYAASMVLVFVFPPVVLWSAAFAGVVLLIYIFTQTD